MRQSGAFCFVLSRIFLQNKRVSALLVGGFPQLGSLDPSAQLRRSLTVAATAREAVRLTRNNLPLLRPRPPLWSVLTAKKSRGTWSFSRQLYFAFNNWAKVRYKSVFGETWENQLTNFKNFISGDFRFFDNEWRWLEPFGTWSSALDNSAIEASDFSNRDTHFFSSSEWFEFDINFKCVFWLRRDRGFGKCTRRTCRWCGRESVHENTEWSKWIAYNLRRFGRKKEWPARRERWATRKLKARQNQVSESRRLPLRVCW